MYVEPAVLGRLDQLAEQHLHAARVLLLMDTNLEALYRSGQLGLAGKFETLAFPPGESSKTRDVWARLTDELLDRGCGRDSGLVALGGGVTGDLVGFVAATYMRGVPYLQVPTTLLAMVDASIGGKTGVDTPKGKNLVGAFHHPSAVITDPLVLNTLPERAFRAGLAETVKHGMIADAEYFEWMESHAREIGRRDPEVLVLLIRRSVEIKAEVVRRDERESGYRAILNAGHTVAHALERVSDFELPHGEAVALGLTVECQIAEDLSLTAPGLRRRVTGLLTGFGIPARPSRRLDPAAVIGAMGTDKKNRGGRIHLALPTAIGRMHRADGWTTAVPEDAIRSALAVIG